MRWKMRRSAWLLALGIGACSTSHGGQSSTSGSNWLRCQEIEDCSAGNAVRCSDDGYCLDAQDQRIAAQAAGIDSQNYNLCDGSSEVRLAVVSGGGQLDSTYQFTNPYGHTFLFVDGKCHYYASRSWLHGTVEGDLTPAQAAQFTRDLKLGQLSQLSYHDLDGCPDAGTFWARAGGGYADCTCGCDDSAPAAVASLLESASAMHSELVDAGSALEFDVYLFALELGAAGAALSGDQRWPFDWPITSVSMTQEELNADPSVLGHRTLHNPLEIRVAHALREQVLAENPNAGRIRVVENGIAYLVFMRDVPPAAAEIDRVMSAQIEAWNSL